MKLSYNWLKDFVDLPNISLEDLSEQLSLKAFEIEDIKPFVKLIDPLVVLGRIEEISKHPDADKLQVTRTNIGSEILQIVCGARNIEVGQFVPVALIGASVTNRKDQSEFQIVKSKIRGVESFGMLCSPSELGFSEVETDAILAKQGDGIYILNDIALDFDLGTSISKVLGQEQDYVLEVGARSNRGDALSVIGQAREVSAVLDSRFSCKSIPEPEQDQSIQTLKPTIDNQEDCQLFYTVALENLSVRPSPKWIQQRINAMGIKSINNIVDISNFVLLEMGQPMHFYDREQLKGSRLIVRRANPGEQLLTLEDKEHELSSINLVIADEQGPVSLAGVMGGKHSSITDQTQNIIIEVAVFNPATVRRSARAAGIESESKRRFERGVDLSHSKQALLRAIELLLEHASPVGSSVRIGKIQIAGTESLTQSQVQLRCSEVKRILGLDLTIDKISELLSKLSIQLKLQSKDSAEFTIPFFRQNDLRREIDLIEEIARLYGYDAIPLAIPPLAYLPKFQEDLLDTWRNIALGFGFSEAKLSSLIGDKLEDLDKQISRFFDMDLSIHMDNPLSLEHRVLRQSLVPGLIQAASRNYSYDKSVDIRLFEIGKTYSIAESSSDLDDVVEETRMAAVMVINEQNWASGSSVDEFYQIKSLIEALIPNAKFDLFDLSQKVLHPGISSCIRIKERGVTKVLGYIARLHPKLSDLWDLPSKTYVFEIKTLESSRLKFKPVSNTPIIQRDITVDIDKDIRAQEILDLVSKKASKDLQKITVVSIYETEDQKSISLRLKWRSDTETLSGANIDNEVVVLKAALVKDLGARFRE